MADRWQRLLQDRLHKQKIFFSRREKGDLLLYVNIRNRGYPRLGAYLYNLLAHAEIREIFNQTAVEEIIAGYVDQLRQSLFGFYLLDDDALPALTDVYLNIGAVTSAMTGREVTFAKQMIWCEPSMEWEEIEKLKFDPDNPWIRLTLELNKALWKFWDEDFLIIGYRHRSPLDAANGIRGSCIFEEMYTEPDRVKNLISWCADWSIGLEILIRDEVDFVEGYRGDLCTWIPEQTVWVNGDAIDLISPVSAKEFDLPYSSRLFSNLGGGFFHHHSIGLHQVKQVASVEGLYLQHIANDHPAGPIPAEVMLNNEVVREQVLEVSMTAPVMLDGTPYRFIDSLLPILEEGRFVLVVECDNASDARECIKKAK